MSDVPQGEGWWQASDGKYYPPQQQPGGAPGGSPGFTPAAGSIDLGAALSYGWKGFTKHVSQFIVVLLIMIAAYIILFGIGAVIAFGSDSFLLQQIVWFVFIALASIVMWSLARPLYKTVVDITNGQAPAGKVQLDFSNLGPWIVTVIIWQGIIWVVGLVPCVGFILSIAAGVFLFLTPFAHLDGREPMEAVTHSYNTVKDNFGQAFLLGLVTWLIALAGMCLCGIAAFVTIPVALIAQGFGWKVLNGQQPAPIPD